MPFSLKVPSNISDNVVLLTVPFKEYDAGQTVHHNILFLFNVNNFDVKLIKLYCSMLIYAVV